jgi:hypothetical protein
MELSMKQLNEYRARPRIGRALAIAAVLLCASALSQPNLAYAGGFHGGGGGFHGGGFHGGGFHGGGFHGGGFHGGGFHDGRFHDGRFHDNRFFFGGSVGFGYPWWGYYPDYGYDNYSQPYASQAWYYCADPAGYYPYVTQCNTGWQTVPAN